MSEDLYSFIGSDYSEAGAQDGVYGGALDTDEPMSEYMRLMQGRYFAAMAARSGGLAFDGGATPRKPKKVKKKDEKSASTLSKDAREAFKSAQEEIKWRAEDSVSRGTSGSGSASGAKKARTEDDVKPETEKLESDFASASESEDMPASEERDFIDVLEDDFS